MGNSLNVPTVDLSGKVAIVTGGNTGIGYELVKGLAEMGAHTIMATRSEERAKAAIARMKESVGSEKELKVEFLPLDLASFQSTKDFVRSFKEKNLPLHILINNAAVAWIPFTKTDDGYEMQYQVNHLGPFFLTLELLPNMLETASTSGDGRILFVSSGAHRRGFGASFNPENLNSELQYERMKVYSCTKLYNVMTSYALQKRLQNVSITVSAQEPGYVRTELNRGFRDKGIVSALNSIGYATIARTPKEGAATTLNCAVNPALNSQQALYYASCKEALSNPDARNEQYQEELWRRSIDVLQDHLSPEILDKYGSSLSPPSAEGDKDAQEDGTIAGATATGAAVAMATASSLSPPSTGENKDEQEGTTTEAAVATATTGDGETEVEVQIEVEAESPGNADDGDDDGDDNGDDD